MERERRINWIGLFIKIVIIFILVLILAWLIAKIINKNKLSTIFKNNIKNMETVSVDYFKNVDLPLNKGDSIKLTLGEMIEKNLIVSIKDKNDEECNTNKSYSKITREKNNYIVETKLQCGKEKDTITKKFDLKDCRNCNNNSSNKKDYDNSEKEKEEISNDIKNDQKEEASSSNITTYYEYVKDTTTYSKWMRGKESGNNIENKYEYYKAASETYYTIGYVREDNLKKSSSLSYTIKLNNIPNSNYYFTKVTDSNYLENKEENKYLNNKSSELLNNKLKYPNSINSYSLTENNFTYKLSPYYREGNFYIDIKVNISNTNGIKPYYDNNIKSNIYYLPLRITLKFISNETTQNKPSGEYEEVSFYRYIYANRETIWSSDNYVEGYTKTGNKKTD